MGQKELKDKELPEDIREKLKALIAELEAREGNEIIIDRTGPGSIDIRISDVEALWYVAYKTISQ
jgi:hypothetical protein